MHKRHAFCRELFFCRARAPGPLAAFLGLLLAGLSASVALGQELDWARRAGGFGRDDGKDIAVDWAGNSYVTGTFASTATFGPGEPNQTILTSAGDADVFVAKYDSAGALVWAKQAGGTGWSEGRGIAVDGAGSSYVTGAFLGMATFGPGEANQTILSSAGDNEVFVAKYDSAGALVWAKRATAPVGLGIAVDGAGSSYVIGYFWGMATFGPGEANQTTLTSARGDVFVAKYDGAGALVWAKRAGGTDDDEGYGIAVDGVGNSYVTGFFGYSEYFGGGGAATFGPGEPNQTILTSDGGGVAFFVAKYNSAGALVWAKRAGGTGWSEGLGIAVDRVGNSYVTGVFQGVATFGPGEANQTILTDAGDNEVFVAKYDSAGALVWAKRATALAGGSIAVDGAGNSYVTGGFARTAIFAPGEANQTTLTGAREDGFVAKYDSAGELVWAKRAGGSIAVDGSGSSYVTGSFGSTATFGPGEANQTILTSTGSFDIFVAKYGSALDNNLSLFVPLVLSFSGANNTLFTSELTLTNRAAKNVILNFSYTAIVGEGSGTASDTLPAGRQRIIPDAIAYLKSIGLSIPDSGNRTGSLVVQFSGLSSSSEGSVLVRTTTAVPEGRAGLAYAGIPTSTTLSGPSYVCGLRQNATDRTNLAIHNTGTASEGVITLRLTVFSGDPAAPSSYTLPDQILFPGGFYQIANILQSNGLSLESGYVRLERVSGTASYYAYALIHDQANADGVFVAPIAEASLAGRRDLTLPVIVETSTFSSELILTNWTASKKSLRIAFVDEGSQTGGPSVDFVIDLNAHQQMVVPNFLEWLRLHGVSGLGSANEPHVGPLYVTVEGGGDVDGIFLGARISRVGQRGRYSLFCAAVPQAMASTDGAWLYGLQQNSENRTNLALINTGDTDSAPNAFTVELFDGETGQKASTVEITLNAWSWTQFESLLAQYAPGTTQGYARVTRTAGSNPFISYAVVTDGGRPGERSGDTAFVSSSP